MLPAYAAHLPYCYLTGKVSSSLWISKERKGWGEREEGKDKETGRKVRKEKGDEREKNERETFVP